ncbi:hypothetical protein [Azospirillum doebereinerae]|uniref:XRE family transcriptional regulator n=1 Tax=Azospirillum doebereinerae TaxID=92933 RepID=A0A3S0XIA4_9PROT|nr:hypothetical protein [Azospirillum doebereinerae]RUQ61982.1 hypothetical protein EJ913_29305 [Azospirillum doebereinerae]
MHIDASIHRICAFAIHKGWSVVRYGLEAAVPPSTARDVLWQRGNPTAMTLRAMEAVIPPDFAPDPDAAIEFPIRRRGRKRAGALA